MKFKVRLNEENSTDNCELTRRVPFDKEGNLRYLPMMCPTTQQHSNMPISKIANFGVTDVNSKTS
jgi:hypothetical protein